MNRHAWVAGVTVSVACAAWYVWPYAAQPETASALPPASPAARTNTSSLSLPTDWPPAIPIPADEPSRVPLPPLGPVVPAAQSLAQAREYGDPRSPPIQRDPDLSGKPTAAELADPSSYQRFEARQNAQLLSAFTQAAESELPKLRNDLEHGRAAGIAPEQLAKVEEKLRRIEDMRVRLLKDHPELGH